jgi:hypothetical protein
MYTKKQFLNKLLNLESKDNTFMWKTNHNKNLPCNDRRITELIRLKILIPIRKRTRCRKEGFNSSYFDNSHIERYLECTELKNKGFKIPQIASHFKGLFNLNTIDLSQYASRKLNTEDKKRIIDTINELTKLLKDNI